MRAHEGPCSPLGTKEPLPTLSVAAIDSTVKGCVSCIFWLARAVLAVLCSFNEARLPKTWGFLKKPMRQIRYLFVTFAVRRHVAPVYLF